MRYLSTPRSLAWVNLIFAVVFGICAVLLFLRAKQSEDFIAVSNSGPDVAQTLYAAGRYDLLRDSATTCSKQFKDLVAATMHAKSAAYSEIADLLALVVIALVLNFMTLRRMGSVAKGPD